MKKRKDGRYSQKVFIGFDSTGKRKYKCAYGKTQRECLAKVKEIESMADIGVVTQDNLTISKLIDIWFKSKQGLSHNTLEMYRNTTRHINKNIGPYIVSEFRPIDAQLFINTLIASGKTRVVNQVLLTAKQIFNFAISSKLISDNPFTDIKPYKYTAKQKDLVSDAEYYKLESSNLDTEEKMFARLVFFSGLRRGEALALTTSDIDFDNNVISINKSICHVHNRPMVKEPKSHSGFRNIPIVESFKPCLQEYVNSLDSKILFPMKTRDEYMTQSSYMRFWNRIREVFDNPNITEYSFRHTYATNLIYSGANVKSVQYVMGHASPEITIGIYTHIDHDRISKDIQKLNKY